MDFDAIVCANMPQIPDFTLKELTPDDIKRLEISAQKKAISKFYETYYLRHYVYEFQSKGVLPVEPTTDEKKLILEIEYDRISTKPPYQLITINPKPGITYLELSSKVEKLVSKKTVSSYIYCYEVRKSQDDTFEGLHCHILLKYDDKPYNFKRGVKSTFKHICNVNDDRILNFKFVSEEFLQSKIDYILGIKTESKKASIDATIAWRLLNDIPSVLESSPPFPCRATQILE